MERKHMIRGEEKKGRGVRENRGGEMNEGREREREREIFLK